MSLQPSKSDQDFTKNLIANQDVLLSPIEQPNDTSLDFFSFINNNNTMLNVIEQSGGGIALAQELDYNNMFQILREDDPEVVQLLETLNGSDFAIDFLPQLSLNTAAKVLDESIESVTDRLQTDSEQLQEEQQLQPAVAYQTIQLKTEFNEDEIIQTNQMIKSTRSSQRLLVKKEKRKNYKSTASNGGGGSSRIKKRKRSIDDEDDLSLNSSENDFIAAAATSDHKQVKRIVTNSVDFETDEHIYCDDDDDEDENEEINSTDYFSNDDDDGEKDFKNYVRNYNLVQKTKLNNKHDPNKKESNKEAATRYRLKKLSEKDRLFETRMCLENENSDVKRKIESTQTEINYLKSLLVQLLLTKGVLDTKF